MITKIAGLLNDLAEETVELQVGPFALEVMIPQFTRRQLLNLVGESIELFTIAYLDGNPAQGKLVPKLVGFLTAAEREFFELFCSVDGVGVKKALRAMVRPVPEVAVMIEEQDVKGLASLPGIGPATSERIVAKLRRKVPRFALLVSRAMATEDDVSQDVVRDAYDALRSLGHSEVDARRLIDGVLDGKAKFKDVDALIQAIYQQQR
jgi:Holliday junction DNA helicase RuvA